ncbi:MAG: glycosyltransferase family 4 protein [Bacteroidota bacterium]
MIEQSNAKIGVYVKKWNPKPNHILKLSKLDIDIFEYGGKQKLIARIWNKLAGKSNINVVSKFQPDLAIINVVNNLDIPALRYRKTLELENIPYIVVVHLAHELFWKNDELLSSFREFYQKAIRVFFVSEHNWMLTEKQLAVKLNNASIVRNPYNCSGKYVLYPKTSADEDSYKLAVVARLSCLHKGHDILFEVLKQTKWKLRNIEITLYGKGENEQMLRKLKELYGLVSVMFGSYHNNIDELWKNHHALVLPSRMEGLPLATVEAMLCGRVVICTNVGGAKEIIEDNRTGFLAETPTVYHLDEALERAWNKRSEWERIGIEARNSIRAILPKIPAQKFAEEIIKLS